jgi:hypothetical protein
MAQLNSMIAAAMKAHQDAEILWMETWNAVSDGCFRGHAHPPASYGNDGTIGIPAQFYWAPANDQSESELGSNREIVQQSRW